MDFSKVQKSRIFSDRALKNRLENTPQGLNEPDMDLYEYLETYVEMHFYYDGKEYFTDSYEKACYGDREHLFDATNTKDGDYCLIGTNDGKSVILWSEPTLDDFIAKGFMGKPLQPVIDKCYNIGW